MTKKQSRLNRLRWFDFNFCYCFPDSINPICLLEHLCFNSINYGQVGVVKQLQAPSE